MKLTCNIRYYRCIYTYLLIHNRYPYNNDVNDDGDDGEDDNNDDNENDDYDDNHIYFFVY